MIVQFTVPDKPTALFEKSSFEASFASVNNLTPPFAPVTVNEISLIADGFSLTAEISQLTEVALSLSVLTVLLYMPCFLRHQYIQIPP